MIFDNAVWLGIAEAADRRREILARYRTGSGVPPKPEKPAMTADERSKLKKELIAARDRQASGAAGAQPMKP